MFRLAVSLPVAYFLLLGPASLPHREKHSVILVTPVVDWAQTSTETIAVEAISKYGGEPAIDAEYGVHSVENRTYQWNNVVVHVLVEEAPDPSAAYGLLTYYRAPTMTRVEGMHLTFQGPQGVLMARGRLFIRVQREKGQKLDPTDFRALLTQVGGTAPSSDTVANLPCVLPTSGLIRGSEKYLLGLEAARRALPASFPTDLIGFAQGAEVQVADYAQARSRATLLAVAYPTPQIARLRFDQMKNLPHSVGEAGGKEPVRGRRLGSFVFLVLNADSARAANKILDHLQVSNSVTWDKPYPGPKPFTLQMMELILANLVFVLILMGLAIVSGLSVVVFRRAMARLFPSSTWGHPDEGNIITLGLS